MEDLQTMIVQTAEAFRKNTGNQEDLDYSVKSLELLDILLEEGADFLPEEEQEGLVQMAGCYLFEVARRGFGGKYYWFSQGEQPVLVTGEPDFEVSILAFDKVKGRLQNGEEDNIPYYFEGYIEAVERGKSQKGYRSMIV